jgi:predicted enzyme related to lactoylglutathione lyase
MGRPVIHFQILSKKPDDTQRFYSDLFGWKVSRDNPLDYRAIDTGSERGIQGGIWPCPPEGHNFVQLFVEVDDVPRYVERVRSLGGNVIVPLQTLPGGDEMAIVLDSQGIPFGLMKTAGANVSAKTTTTKRP